MLGWVGVHVHLFASKHQREMGQCLQLLVPWQASCHTCLTYVTTATVAHDVWKPTQPIYWSLVPPPAKALLCLSCGCSPPTWKWPGCLVPLHCPASLVATCGGSASGRYTTHGVLGMLAVLPACGGHRLRQPHSGQAIMAGRRFKEL